MPEVSRKCNRAVPECGEILDNRYASYANVVYEV